MLFPLSLQIKHHFNKSSVVKLYNVEILRFRYDDQCRKLAYTVWPSNLPPLPLNLQRMISLSVTLVSLLDNQNIQWSSGKFLRISLQFCNRTMLYYAYIHNTFVHTNRYIYYTYVRSPSNFNPLMDSGCKLLWTTSCGSSKRIGCYFVLVMEAWKQRSGYLPLWIQAQRAKMKLLIG